MPVDQSQYPLPRCHEPVGGGFVSYPCWLNEGHDGPHSATEIPSSGKRRREWEESQKKSEPGPEARDVAGAPPPPPICTTEVQLEGSGPIRCKLDAGHDGAHYFMTPPSLAPNLAQPPVVSEPADPLEPVFPPPIEAPGPAPIHTLLAAKVEEHKQALAANFQPFNGGNSISAITDRLMTVSLSVLQLQLEHEVLTRWVRDLHTAMLPPTFNGDEAIKLAEMLRDYFEPSWRH